MLSSLNFQCQPESRTISLPKCVLKNIYTIISHADLMHPTGSCSHHQLIFCKHFTSLTIFLLQMINSILSVFKFLSFCPKILVVIKTWEIYLHEIQLKIFTTTGGMIMYLSTFFQCGLHFIDLGLKELLRMLQLHIKNYCNIDENSIKQCHSFHN